MLEPAHKACSATITRSNVGPFTDPALQELSGIAASTRNPGVLWVHNDSGDTARDLRARGQRHDPRHVHPLGRDGDRLGGHRPRPRPVARNRSYLYVGDIGDNAAAPPRDRRVPGAGADGDGDAGRGHGRRRRRAAPSVPRRRARRRGAARRPGVRRAVRRSSKNLAGGPVGVYRAPANLGAGSTTTLEHVGHPRRSPAGLANAVTAADVSPDGQDRRGTHLRLGAAVGPRRRRPRSPRCSSGSRAAGRSRPRSRARRSASRPTVAATSR